MALEIVPVMVGSAYKNKGVQSMLDNVWLIFLLPWTASKSKPSIPKTRASDPLGPRFQQALGGFGLQTHRRAIWPTDHTRIYQGTIKKGSFVYNARTGKKVRVKPHRAHVLQRPPEETEAGAKRHHRLGWYRLFFR